MEIPTTPSPDRERLECEKLAAEQRKFQAEHDKLAAETAEIKRPFWKKAAFWAAATPTILVIVGALFTWANGWFDVQQKYLMVQREELTLGNAKLEDDRISLTNTLSEMRNELGLAVSKLKLTTQSNTELAVILQKREQTITTLNTTISNIVSQSTNDHLIMADQLRGALLSAQQNAEHNEELRNRLLIAAEHQFEIVQLWNESNSRFYGAATEVKRTEAFRISNDSLLTNCAPMITDTASDIKNYQLGELALTATNRGRFVHVLGIGFRDPRFPAWWQVPNPPQPGGLRIRADSSSPNK